MTTKMKLTSILCAVVFGTITFANQIAAAADNDAPTPKLEMRTFKIDIDALLTKAGKPANDTAEAKRQTVLKYFSDKGVDLQSPKNLFLNFGKSLLFVRATSSDLDQIQGIIEDSMRNYSPQLHLKAYFIEIPTVAAQNLRQDSLPENIGKETGILTDQKWEALRSQFKSLGGVETLSEPEGITTSGREIQMRVDSKTSAGQMVDILPWVLSDEYTIKMKMTVSTPDSLTTEANVWDGQTVFLGKTNDKGQIFVFVTATLVDSTGKPLHAADEMAVIQKATTTGIPPQQ
jgi:hypothetical protein